MRAPDAGPFLGELTESVALQFLAAAPFSLVLTDPRQPDNPIVYANQAFCDISGYPKSEIIGRNCRFLQGPATDPHTVERIQKALRDNDEVMVDILNYHKNGTPFWNRLLISPLRAPDGTVLFFSGVQKRLAAEDQPDNQRAAIDELHHRVKNHLAMVRSLIRMHGRDDSADPRCILNDAANRIDVLSLLYEQLTYRPGENRQAVVLSDYLERITLAIGALGDQDAVQVSLQADRFTVPVEHAVHIAMIVSECVTNAMQHAFEEGADGLVAVTVAERADGGIRIQIRDDGRGFPDGVNWPSRNSLGGRLALELSTALSGELDVVSGPSGTTVTFQAPPAVREIS